MPRFRFMSHGLPLVAATLFGFSLWSVLGATPRPHGGEPPRPVPENPFPAGIAAVGLVEPAGETVAVATELGGVITAIFVHPGDRVAAGTPLFAIDDRSHAAALARAEANVDAAAAAIGRADERLGLQPARIRQADATVKSAEAETERATLDRVRYARLAAADWASRQRQETADADARKAEAGLAAARAALAVAEGELTVLRAERAEAAAALAQARAALAAAAVDLDRTVVKAPITGTVLRINLRPGEFAQAGLPTKPLMTMGTLDILHVRATVDEADAGRVRPGATATAMLRGNAAVQAPLTFVRIEPDLTPKRSLSGTPRPERVDTRVLEVLFRFDPARFPARVGQQVDLFITEGPSDGVPMAELP